MSTAIKDIDLSAETITYGQVQFGGSGGPLLSTGSAAKGTPPQISLHMQAEYDEANRTVVSHLCTLEVKCHIYDTTYALQQAQLQAIRRQLLTPRLALTINTIGAGIEAFDDIEWGPRPISCSIRTIGRQAAELNWTCEFRIAPCDVSRSNFPEHFKSFIFAQSYSIDDEGLLTRVTAGNWTIAPQLAASATQGADGFRGSVAVAIPTGFRRVRQEYSESPNKERMDFSIVDTQLRGDALPDNMTRGQGSFGIDSDGMFANAVATLAASLTVKPGQPPSLAALTFFTMAQQKYEDLRDGYDVAVIPMAVSFQRGLFEDSRTTRFSFTWSIAGCIAQFMAPEFWEAVPGTNYTTWRASMANLWGPRGVSGIASVPASDARVNLCTATGSITIATGDAADLTDNEPEDAGIDCEEVDPEKSWLKYNVRVRFIRDENSSRHKQAVEVPITPSTNMGDIYGTSGVDIPGHFDADGKEDIEERNGTPDQYVIIEAKGIRIQHYPSMPILTEFAGKSVTQEREDIQVEIVGNAGCPIRKLRGWRLYKIEEYVEHISETPETPTICAPPEPEPEPEEP